MKPTKLILLASILLATGACSDDREILTQDLEVPELEDDLLELIGTTDIDTLYSEDMVHINGRSKVYGGVFTGGKPHNLSSHVGQRSYYLPRGYTPDDILAMAMDGSSNYMFTWFKNGKVCAGKVNDLESIRLLYNYRSDTSPSFIVGIAIDGDNNKVFAFYGTTPGQNPIGSSYQLAIGNTSNLSKYYINKRYSFANNYYPANSIIDVGIDGSSNTTYIWHSTGDGRVACVYGNQGQFHKTWSNNVQILSNRPWTDIVGIGFDGLNGSDIAYTYYK